MARSVSWTSRCGRPASGPKGGAKTAQQSDAVADEHHPADPGSLVRSKAKQSGAAKARADFAPGQGKRRRCRGTRHLARPCDHRSGWGGIRTHERLSPLPVFKVGEGGSATPEGITLENKGETLLKPSSTGSRDQGPSGEIEPNRDTTRQIETTDETSPRQVAVGLSRNDREWDPPPSPALSSQPRTRHAPWQFQFCLSQREADPISLLQLPAGHRHPSQGFVRSGIPLRGWTRLGGGRSGKHPAARGSAADENGQWRQDGGLGRLARRADMTGRGSQPPLAGSQRRNGDAGAPPPAVCWGGVDILHGAPVNAPASRG